jgi:SAM-dependent methyltransferase
LKLGSQCPVRVAYDFLADAYDERALPRSVALAGVLERTGILAGARVLDLGVGTGLLWACLDWAHGPAWVVGVDSSAGMLVRARSRGQPCVNLVQADFARLPFRLQTFDLAVACFSARHCPELTLVLAETARRLTGNGHVMLVEYCSTTQLAFAGAVMRCYSFLAEAGERPARPPTPFFSACPDNMLLAAATDAGFRIKHREYVSVQEAEGREQVVDFVMNSPPIAFDLVAYGRHARDAVRDRLLADCKDGVLPEQVSSNILVCVLGRPDGG